MIIRVEAWTFPSLRTVRAARDFQHGGLDAGIGDASEIAFFPPVSGG